MEEGELLMMMILPGLVGGPGSFFGLICIGNEDGVIQKGA
jgi:hypothetical protein